MSDSYRSHKDVAERLERQLQSVVSAQDQRDLQQHAIGIHEVELSEEVISSIYQKWFSHLKRYYTRLPTLPKKKDRPKLEYIELAIIDGRQRNLISKIQISDFLQATMQGIDAVHSKSGSIKYEEILDFRDDEPSTGRRIVISGAPGCGKSTLSRQLCKDLSSKKLPNNYQMVVLVELRELIFRIKQDKELDLKHLFVKYAAKSLNHYNICDALDQSDGKNVMFILDGYDELEESLRSCRLLKRILSTHDPTQYLSECDIVITTRPVTCKELFTLVENPHRHVEILGFKKEHIEEYIDKYFEKLFPVSEQSMANAQKLKEKLCQLPHVCGMCRIPIVLEIVCKVHYLRGDHGIPETQTGIYQEYIIAELINSKEGQKIFINDLLTVSEVDFPGFYELCQKAFECCSTEQRLLLTEHDVSNLIQYEKRGSIYGLLFVEVVDSLREGGNIRLYHYLHKSIQEMLAAVHVSTLQDSEHTSLWEKHLGRVEMGEIWKYYAGITSLKKLKTSILQKMCQKKIREEDHKKLLIISLFEANNPDVAAEVLPEIFPNGLISIAAGSSYEVTALNYCIKHHPTVKGMEFTGPRPFLKFGEPLRDMMRSLHASSSVDSLSFSQLHQEDWKLFSDTLPPNSSITCARLGHVPVYIVTEVLLKCDLKKLILDGMINVTKNRSSASSAGSLDDDLFCRKAAALDWLEFSVTSANKLTKDSPIERLVSSIVKKLINTTSALEITTEDPCNKENSDAKWKTVKLSLPERITGQNNSNIFKSMMSIMEVLIKELSSCKSVQHLICDAMYPKYIREPHEYGEPWMSSLKLLLVLRLTSQLTLRLSPAEWAAILCGVGDAEDLEELNVTMKLTDDNTPVDEKELCEAWSQCKCKRVKMKISYHVEWTELNKSFVRTLLKGISLCQNVQHLMIDCGYNCSSEYDES